MLKITVIVHSLANKDTLFRETERERLFIETDRKRRNEIHRDNHY